MRAFTTILITLFGLALAQCSQGETVNIREYIRKLFRGTDRQFSIAPEVGGTIQVSKVESSAMSFEQRLCRALLLVGALCRLEEGVYVIKPDEKILLWVGSTPARQRRGPIVDSDLRSVTQDTEFLWMLRDKVIYKFRKADLKVMDQTTVRPKVEDLKVNLKAEALNIREVLRFLFKQVDLAYTIEPSIKGDVTVTLSGVAFADALILVLRQVDARYEVEGGVYMIKPLQGIRESLGTGRLVASDPSLIPSGHQLGNVLARDDLYIYALLGDTIYKLDKNDLKQLASRRLGE